LGAEEEQQEGGLPGSGASPFSGSVSTAFTAGISHIDGKYRFTQNNYLLEGAQKISALAGPGARYCAIAGPAECRRKRVLSAHGVSLFAFLGVREKRLF
jgi:hypothetical protein